MSFCAHSRLLKFLSFYYFNNQYFNGQPQESEETCIRSPQVR